MSVMMPSFHIGVQGRCEPRETDLVLDVGQGFGEANTRLFCTVAAITTEIIEAHHHRFAFATETDQNILQGGGV